MTVVGGGGGGGGVVIWLPVGCCWLNRLGISVVGGGGGVVVGLPVGLCWLKMAGISVGGVGGGLVSGCGDNDDSSAPQSKPKTGYLSFVLLLLLHFLFPDAGVESLSCILFLAGDLAMPLSRFTLQPNSCILLKFVLSPSQDLTLSSISFLSSSSPTISVLNPLFSILSSTFKVNLPIVQRLYSPLLLRTMSSPSLCITTASYICLVSAVLRNVTGLRWNFGSCPPW